MREDSLIPYQATELAGERVLVLAAHPDDEVLGCGGTLRLNAGRAEEVRVWIATDGTAQEREASGDEGSYGELRREEARRALAELGVHGPHFGGLPDRSLVGNEALEASLDAQLRDFRPDLILAPAPSEIHPDHRAIGEAIYRRLSSSRPGDPDHDHLRSLRLAFYEISHPILPNVLVDIAGVSERKSAALAAYGSQQAVRDYAGAIGGLNAYRRLTLSGSGPVEAFRVVSYEEASTRSLEEFRRSIGPAVIRDGDRGPAPVSVVVRTRNRPALLRDALESLSAQTARPRQVVVVNDGGASPAEVTASFRDRFSIVLEESPERAGRSAAANRGAARAAEELLTFLDDDDRCFPDHLDRLARAHRSGPEPVCYTDAVTVVYERRGESWEPRHRALQYSLDFDPDYLLLANYIPIHTLILPRALYRKSGGFDETLDYSEDWDFLIRLSFDVSFRHVRGVTCEYRVFGEGNDPLHAAAGGPAFQDARRKIYERYRERRTEAGLARVLDRLRSQVAFWYGRDAVSQGELGYQRESHRRLDADVAERERRLAAMEADRDRLLGDLEAARFHAAEVANDRERAEAELTEAHVEIERLSSILSEIYASRTWKLHLFLDRLRGRR
ncbi:MAG: PIG-L family deacetylase [Thermoanaerobaculia bacterium]|nr:PIG-L family deacetylase [Thermoanaerobaculia bacterium]